MLLIAEKGGAPISDNDLVSSAYVALKNTGAYDTATINWDNKPIADQTWGNFKTFFI